MAQFDPRRQPTRLAPHLLTTAAAVTVALLAGRAYEPAKAEEVPVVTAAQMDSLEAQAFAAAGAPQGLTAPEAVPVQIRRGESFEDAVRRTGVTSEEASAVAATVAGAFDLADLRAGRGMGYALPAELNGYPGPSHTLENADALRLSPAQRERTKALFEAMKAEAVPLGERLIQQEAELERLFAERAVTPASLEAATSAIGWPL